MDDTAPEKQLKKDTRSKNAFKKLAEIYFKTSMLHSKRTSIHLTEEMTETYINQLNSENKKAGNEDIYTLTTKDGKSIVTLNNIYRNRQRQILPFTEIYDLLMDLHVLNNHEITDTLQAKIENEYIIPRMCFNLIQITCRTCRNNPLRGARANGVVTFLYNLVRPRKLDTQYDSVLIYMDEFSEYIILRPTKASYPMDVSMELFKIFMEFGPPEKVYLFYQIGKFSVVEKTIETLCPECKIIDERHEVETVLTVRVMRALMSWMKDENSDAWEIGCSLIQNNLNNAMKPRVGNVYMTSQDIFFNNLSRKLLFKHDNSTANSDDEPLSMKVSKLNIQRLNRQLNKSEENYEDTDEKLNTNVNKKNKIKETKTKKPSRRKKKGVKSKTVTVDITEEDTEGTTYASVNNKEDDEDGEEAEIDFGANL